MKGPWISVCSVNPLFGIEDKLVNVVKPAEKKKKVAVIGGGPAGMRAALTCAERGHFVTLFEQSGYLGGQLLHAEYFSFKWGIRNYRNWLVHQLEKAGVDIRLNTRPEPEEIKEAGFDAVIAACGAGFGLPSSIEGLKDEQGRALYPTCADIFGKEAELGRKVVICGGSETGVETAMYLAENGHDVTVLTRQNELAADASHLHYITMAYMTVGDDGLSRLASIWERYDNLHGITEVTTKRVKDDTVFYTDLEGNEHAIQADSVVICGGSFPKVDEALRYSGCAAEFYAVGDCSSAGNLWRSGRDSWAAASRI